MADPGLPRHYITFLASNGLEVRALRGDGAPKLSAGGARWEVINLPRRVGATQWMGRDPFVLDVPILFDHHASDESIEPDARALNKMRLSQEFTVPPTIKIIGAVPITDRDWVIQGIDWGDDVYWVTRGDAPYRTRQDAVVHFLEYRPQARVKILAKASLPHAFEVQKGTTTTLRKIAKEMTGDANNWRKIKNANPSIRDPNKVVGPKRVRIP